MRVNNLINSSSGKADCERNFLSVDIYPGLELPLVSAWLKVERAF